MKCEKKNIARIKNIFIMKKRREKKLYYNIYIL